MIFTDSLNVFIVLVLFLSEAPTVCTYKKVVLPGFFSIDSGSVLTMNTERTICMLKGFDYESVINGSMQNLIEKGSM